jgi:cyclopropane fatty-acyl-phospholipid synthase-like methyltransferase
MLLDGVRNWLARAPGAEKVPEPLAAFADPLPDLAVVCESAWAPARVEVAARLWGEGFIFPGGQEEALRFATPLGLSPASSLLLLGCGAGGPARSIASQLGVWVSGFESDPGLVAAASVLCAQAGLGQRAVIEFYDPDSPRFAHRSFHHALAFEPVRTCTPETVLAALTLALRPGGQMAFVQTVANGRFDPADPTVCDWSRLERRNPAVPTETTISRVLGRLGFDIRVAEDISDRHMKLAMRGWRDAVRLMRERPSASAAAVLVREAELWLLRIRLIRSGRLRLVRWHAIHRGGR